jgi:hypothetical protein
MTAAIDNWNYYRDPRVANAGDNKAPILFGCETCYQPEGCCDCTDDQYGSGQIALPTRWTVCPTCNGAGRHVNPAIDCNGLTAADFAEDPDFEEAYFGGTFDQTCNQCAGRTTVPAVDRDACNPALLAAFDEQQNSYYDDLATQRAELALGC